MCAGPMPHRTSRAHSFVLSIPRAWLSLLVLLVVLCSAGRAQAYPWMIRHGYAQCTQCHIDPSGAGAMTQYGRAMGELILRSHYQFERAPDEDAKAGQFLFGAVPLPDALGLGGDVSLLSLHTKVDRVQLQHSLI